MSKTYLNRWSFIETKKIKDIKCGAAIFTEDLKYIVLIQNNYSYNSGIEQWGLPKGKLEYNETYESCTKREINEETGLQINIKNLMFKKKVMSNYYFSVFLKNKEFLNPKDNVEIKSAKWFRVKDLDTTPINRETRLFIKYNLDYITQNYAL